MLGPDRDHDDLPRRLAWAEAVETPRATVNAVSVLPFQATATTSPIVGGTVFGTIITGRPLSKSASSSVASAIEASFSGCSTRIRS